LSKAKKSEKAAFLCDVCLVWVHLQREKPNIFTAFLVMRGFREKSFLRSEIFEKF